MTDSQRRLADGIAAVVRLMSDGKTKARDIAANAGDLLDGWYPEIADDSNSPPLSPLQSLALSVLVSQTAENGAMLIDALIEAGVIDGDWEAMVRADEREKVAGRVGDYMQACGYSERLPETCQRIMNVISPGATS